MSQPQQNWGQSLQYRQDLENTQTSLSDSESPHALCSTCCLQACHVIPQDSMSRAYANRM
eukprot:4428965-Amphidinium_carterae.2